VKAEKVTSKIKSSEDRIKEVQKKNDNGLRKKKRKNCSADRLNESEVSLKEKTLKVESYEIVS
jgi:hypothetical protein